MRPLRGAFLLLFRKFGVGAHAERRRRVHDKGENEAPHRRTRSVTALALLACLAPLRAVAADPCPAETPCAVEDGTYALGLPKSWDGKAALPALVFFHGYGSSAGATLGRDDLRAELDRRGWLLIAPNGLVPPGRERTTWSHEGSPSHMRDEVAFTHAVLDDVAKRLALDRGRLFVGGFSQGSSMAWHVACLDPAPYAGFVALSGAFWDPMPESCPAPPRRLVHFHGLLDQTVPLEGRPIGGRFKQSDVFASLAVLRRSWDCPSMPDEMTVEGGLRCRTWPACAKGGALRFCLHDGGHAAPEGWAKEAFDWLEGR